MNVAELLVSIGVRADARALGQFQGALANTQRTAGATGISMKRLGGAVAAVTAGVAGAVTGIVALTNSVARTADVVAKNARRAGIGAQEYQRLAFAAKEADVAEGALIKSSNLLAASIAKATTGDASAEGFSGALRELGVELDDLRGKTKTQQFGVLADALNRVEDRGKRAALASELFGARLGPELANLLAMGSEGINKTGEALRNVFTDEELQAAEDYQDRLTEMGDAFDHVKTRAAVGLIPVMTEIVERVSAFIDENDELIEQDIPAFLEGLTEAVSDSVDMVAEAVDEWQNLATIFDDIEDAVAAITDGFTRMGEQIRKTLEETLGFEKAQDIIQDTQDILGIAFGPATTAIVQDRLGQGAVERERKEAKQEASRAGQRSLKRFGELTDRVKLGGDLYRSADVVRGRGADKRRDAVRGLAADVIAGNISERDAKAAARELLTPPRRTARGGGKRAAAADDAPSADELVNSVAGGAGIAGTEGGPTPHVAITITNNNTFDMDIHQEFSRHVTPEDVGRPLLEVIQREINKQNVEASRTIAPVVLR